MLKAMLIKIMRDLNDNGTADNPEYLRGQIEMAMNILGYSTPDDLDGDNLYDELLGAVRELTHVPYPGEPFQPEHEHDWADGICHAPDCAATL